MLIAGNGVAASALACVLRDSGFGVVLLTRRRPGGAVRGVVEALPEATVRLFAEIGLATEVATAGAVTVGGFDNAYGPGPARRLEGRWTHVDRARLARACLLAARRRGATELPVADVGMSVASGESGVQVCAQDVHGVQGSCLRGFAAVDATGRAAWWSRPVSRVGAGGAALFSGPGSARPRRGCVTRPRVPATLWGPLAARLGIADPQSYVRGSHPTRGRPVVRPASRTRPPRHR